MCGVDGTTYQNSCFGACSFDNNTRTYGLKKDTIRHSGRCVGTKSYKGAKEWIQCGKVVGRFQISKDAYTYKWVDILIGWSSRGQ